MLVCDPNDHGFNSHTRTMAPDGFTFVVAHGSANFYKRKEKPEDETIGVNMPYCGNVWDGYVRVKKWPVSECFAMFYYRFINRSMLAVLEEACDGERQGHGVAPQVCPNDDEPVHATRGPGC
jgi:hypothetical protein